MAAAGATVVGVALRRVSTRCPDGSRRSVAPVTATSLAVGLQRSRERQCSFSAAPVWHWSLPELPAAVSPPAAATAVPRPSSPRTPVSPPHPAAAAAAAAAAESDRRVLWRATGVDYGVRHPSVAAERDVEYVLATPSSPPSSALPSQEVLSELEFVDVVAALRAFGQGAAVFPRPSDVVLLRMLLAFQHRLDDRVATASVGGGGDTSPRQAGSVWSAHASSDDDGGGDGAGDGSSSSGGSGNSSSRERSEIAEAAAVGQAFAAAVADGAVPVTGTAATVWPDVARLTEVATGTRITPVESNTSVPFTLTNVITFQARNGDMVLVDPGCNSSGAPALQALLEGPAAASRCQRLLVFITHHHGDHVDGLADVARARPDAVVYTHANTLRRMGGAASLFGLEVREVEGGEVLELGDASGVRSRPPVADDDDDGKKADSKNDGATAAAAGEPPAVVRLQVVYTPGHTDGHASLLDTTTRLLVAGDHIVGLGSALLDPSGGGHMGQYLATTRDMLQRDCRIVCPAHGAPVYDSSALLEGYIEHRHRREDSILAAYREMEAEAAANPRESGGGAVIDLDALVAKVYTDVPESAWALARQNVFLHMQHLQEQGLVPVSARF